MAEIIATNNSTVTEKEELANYSIAVDKKKGKLFSIEFDSRAKGKAELKDLQNIKSAKADYVEDNNICEGQKRKPVSPGTHISKVQLALTPKGSNQPKYYFTFYHALLNGIDETNTLKRRAQHWQERVNNYIKKPESLLSEAGKK